MNTLDLLIEALCREAESLTVGKSVELKGRKWIRTEAGIALQDFPNYETVFLGAISNQSFQKTEVHNAVERWLMADPVFSTASEKAGYHGRPEVLIQRFLLDAMSVKNGEIQVDPTIAKDALARVGECFASSEVVYEATARLLGVELTTPSISLADNLHLIKLTDEEVNDRQPDLTFLGMHDTRSTYLGHHTEIRMILPVPVDNRLEVPFLSAENVASGEVLKSFDDVISALRLYRSGNIELGPISVSSFILTIGIGKIYSIYVPVTEMVIGDSDVGPLQQAYRVITEGQMGDKALERSLHRFLLGKRRYDFLDRLVDYVIAWESLLLTINKRAEKTELSYRFGINGANILNACGVQKNREAGLRVMKGLYSVRSEIVHGSNDNDINKEVKKAGFDSMTDLVNDSEENFRRVIFWLSELDSSERPYNKSGGWEQLLWGNGILTDL
jgi:hypothetical protein